MKKSRRDFIKKSYLIGGLSFSTSYAMLIPDKVISSSDLKSEYISLDPPNNKSHYLPLERVDMSINLIDKGVIKVFDGRGNEYYSDDVRGRLNFKVGGYLGYHMIQVFDTKEKLMDQISFPVNGKTEINDKNGEFGKMLDMLKWSMFNNKDGTGHMVRYNNSFYKLYAGWFLEHVNVVSQGLKYFVNDIEGGIDLYSDSQRSDGLIFDNYKYPYTETQSYWEQRFDYDGFVYRPEDPLSSCIFVKIPVENIGQYTFIEGLYATWKANGDDTWMEKHIEKAIKAIEYIPKSKYYWSGNFKLLRRPFTIDIWDFQPTEDADIAGGDALGVILGKTRFGIHYGDNIAFANSCEQLAEMLDYINNPTKAASIRALGKEIRNKIDDLAWNGSFYTHHIPEDPSIVRDLGVDQSIQVSLSNALSINRGLDHRKCVSILKTYQNLQKQMPPGSPGEWYTIYPPFGSEEFGSPKWQYMNGGVTPIVAGELAKGAFENGFEAYGVDILRRLFKIAQLKNNSLKGCYRGAMPKSPVRSFLELDIKKLANTNKSAGTINGVQGWIGSETDDFRNLPSGRQINHEIPFMLIDPETNGKKACLVLSGDSRFTARAVVPVNDKQSGIYFLHTSTKTPSVAGIVKIEYTDNTYHHHYITNSASKSNSGEITHWCYPTINPMQCSDPISVVWWRGPSTKVKDVGLICFGLNNPFPDKTIKQIILENENLDGKWVIFGITLCKEPVFFMPDIESSIPDHWAAAHVTNSLLEGLAGIQDKGVAFNNAYISPKWDAAGIEDVSTMVKYESSGGYVSYKYKLIPAENKLIIEFTGNAHHTLLRIPIPKKKQLAGIYCDREIGKYDFMELEDSDYADLEVRGIGVHLVEVRFS